MCAPIRLSCIHPSRSLLPLSSRSHQASRRTRRFDSRRAREARSSSHAPSGDHVRREPALLNAPTPQRRSPAGQARRHARPRTRHRCAAPSAPAHPRSFTSARVGHGGGGGAAIDRSCHIASRRTQQRNATPSCRPPPQRRPLALLPPWIGSAVALLRRGGAGGGARGARLVSRSCVGTRHTQYPARVGGGGIILTLRAPRGRATCRAAPRGEEWGVCGGGGGGGGKMRRRCRAPRRRRRRRRRRRPCRGTLLVLRTRARSATRAPPPPRACARCCAAPRTRTRRGPTASGAPRGQTPTRNQPLTDGAVARRRSGFCSRCCRL
jgi:hypothetical protein